MNNSLTTDRRFIISNFKEMYESNNRVLTSITQIHNENINSEIINNLINNIITANNEIMRNITNVLNYNNLNINNNLNNNRQQNSIRHQNRQHHNRQNNNNNNRFNYINEPIFNYPNSGATDARITNFINTFLEPIEIFPTPSQIESATRVVRFGDIITPLNTACPITLENFNENDQVLVIRHCEHVFSNTGLISWFRTNCRCPVCRYDIRSHVSDLSGNVAISPSSTILSSPLNSVERRVRNNSSSILVDLIFSNLLDTHNLNDISDNNVSDASGNLLRLLFTS